MKRQVQSMEPSVEATVEATAGMPLNQGDSLNLRDLCPNQHGFSRVLGNGLVARLGALVKLE